MADRHQSQRSNLALRNFRKRMATADVDHPQGVSEPITTSCNNSCPSYPQAIHSLTSCVLEVVTLSQRSLEFAEQICKISQNLEMHEVAVLNLFFRPFGRDEQSLYELIQKRLSCHDSTRLTQFMPYLEMLLAVLAKLPRFQGTVWHMVKKDLSNVYPRNLVFSWRGFLSCPVNFEFFETVGGTDDRTLFSIFTSSGRMVQEFSEDLDAAEILIQPGTFFQVISVLELAPGLKLIQVKEVEHHQHGSKQAFPMLLKIKTEQVDAGETLLINSDVKTPLEQSGRGNDILTAMRTAVSLGDIDLQENFLDCIVQGRISEFSNDLKTNLINSVTDAMKIYHPFGTIQRKGCRALLKLLPEGETVLELVRLNSISVILATMKHHINDVSIQAEGLLVLLRLCSGSASAEVWEVENEIKRILHTMRHHPENKTLNELGCRLLCKIAGNKNNALQALSHKNGVAEVVSALRLLRSEPSLQIFGWWALISLRGENVATDEKAEWPTNCFATLIVHTMGRYKQEVDVQVEGLHALQNHLQEAISKRGPDENISITDLLTILRAHNQNKAVAEHGCALLADLTRTKQNVREVASNGGINLLLSLMRQHYKMAAVQEHASRALRIIATNGYSGSLIEDEQPDTVPLELSNITTSKNASLSHDPEHRLAIKEAGGKEVILLAMKTYPNHVGIQRQGCLALGALHETRSNEVDAVNAEEVKVILSTLVRHQNSIALQRAAFQTLLVWTINPQNKVTVAKCGGVETILLSLLTHIQNEKLQADGMNILKELSFDEMVGHCILRQGGVDTVLFTMRVYFLNATIQARGCQILTNISSIQETTSQELGTSRVNKPISTLCTISGAKPTELEAKPDYNRSLSISPELYERLKGTVMGKHQRYNATYQVDTKESIPGKLAQAGAINRILRAMKLFSNDIKVQKQGCRAVGALAVDKRITSRLLSLSVMEILHSTMRKHSTIAVIQLEACRAIAKISASVDPSLYGATVDAVNVVIDAVNLHSQNKAIQLEGCRALGIFAYDELNRLKLIQNGAINAVRTAMRLHHHDAPIQELGCQFLIRITSTQSFWSEIRSVFFGSIESTARTKVISGGGLDTILHTMSSHDDNRVIQLLSLELILCLCTKGPEPNYVRERVASNGGGDLARRAMGRFHEDGNIQQICTELLTCIGRWEKF